MTAYQWKLFERDGTATIVDVQPPNDSILTIPGDSAKPESLSFDLVGLCNIAEQFCGGRKIMEVQKISAGGYHDIYEFRSDGDDSKVSLIARFSNQWTLDLLGQEHCSRQVASEVAVMALLRHANIPIPRCLSHSVAQSEPWAGPPWMLLEKCSGVSIEWCRPGTSKETKLHMLHEFANISVQLSQVPLPSSAPIGSVITFDATSQSVEIGPLYIPGCEVDQKPAVGPFATYQAYISHLVERAEQITANKPCKELQDILALAERLAPSGESSSDNHMWRPTLIHALSTTDKILSKDGHIHAILGWNFHAVMPAFLALHFPTWLVDEGINDRRFAPMCLDGATCTRAWTELAGDAAEYRKVFAQSVNALDPGYMKIVEAGSRARQLVNWLLQWRGDDLFLSSFAAWKEGVDGPESITMRESFSDTE